MSFLAPSIQIGSRAGQAALTQMTRQLPKISIFDFFKNLFPTVGKVAIPTAIKTGAKIAIPTGIKAGAGTIAKKFGTQAVVGSGFVFGSTALLTLTGGGQNLVSTTGQGIKDFSNFGQSVNKLLESNPLIPIGLLILGGLVVVTVIKK